MLRDITLGQFFPGNSLLHRMDPRVKILWTLFYIILLFFVDTYWGFLLYGIFTVGLIVISQIRPRLVLSGLRPLLYLLIFTAILNIFVSGGETVLFRLWIFRATKEGLYNAGMMALRLIFLVLGSSMLTFTTSPIVLTDGIEHLLRPFRKIGLPAHEIAMMMTIAIRFIPTILEETDKIMKAQAARGADFETGSIFRRAKAMIPLLIPLFISAFRRADELAVAMECRCYHGGEGRSRLHTLRISSLDYKTVPAALVLCAGVVLTRIYL
ncbi:MAG: energy-coupling factor transporter transmembrane protein EcfT [Ruminococcaceae bacterium]|nr:energy-coupling factor transporter transmembrane protein EcfT [Oscillospiraceae bacterium]